MTLAWLDWTDDVLRVAREERRPVLLSIVASWSRFCREMDETTFDDPAVRQAIADFALPVRVDKDLRPDLEARYGQGGWPGTALIDPESLEVILGGTFFDAPALAALVAEAAQRCRTVGPRPAAPAPPAAPTGRLDESVLPAIDAALLASFDARHGGFGSGQKFPHPEALDYALMRYANAARPGLLELIEKTLTHMAEGRLHDPVEGGFFRYCARRDWTGPHTEKLLDANAGLARNYLEAGQLLQRQGFLDVGARAIELLLARFRDAETGLFHASQAADDEYYRKDLAERRTRRAPPTDGRFLADANARAASALFKAGAVLRRDDVTEAALAAVDGLLRVLWTPGRGVYHYADENGRRLPGLLRDQGETARALLHALQYTDERRFLPPLLDLLERLGSDHVGDDGELVDRDDVLAGLPRRLDRAILDSAVAAEALIRGGLYTGRRDLGRLGRAVLERYAGQFRRYGYAMAAYGRSVELVLNPPLHIVVVGRRDDPRADALYRAASRAYLPSRVVQRLDPVEDADTIEALELPERTSAVCFVHHEHDCAAEHDDPDTLVDVLLAAAARRG